MVVVAGKTSIVVTVDDPMTAQESYLILPATEISLVISNYKVPTYFLLHPIYSY